MIKSTITSLPYRLGQLFSALEADKKIKGAKWYTICSENPKSGFDRLISLGQTPNEIINGELFQGILSEGFPARLDNAQQCEFAVGYYHDKKHIENNS